jgi:hypothetical protein
VLRAGGIVATLCLAMLAIVPSAAAGPTGAVQSPEAEVTSSHLRVREDSRINPHGFVFTTLTLAVDLNRQTRERFAELMRTREGYSLAYRNALAYVLALEGLLSGGEAGALIDNMRGIPKIVVADGRATVRARVQSGLDQRGGSPVFRTVVNRVPAGASFVLGLDTGHDHPVAAWPVPRRDDGEGHLLWKFGEGEAVHVGVRFDGISNSYDTIFLRDAVSFLAAALPFAVLIVLLWGRAGIDMSPRRRLFWFAVGAFALLSGVIVCDLIVQIFGNGEGGVVQALVPSLGLAVFVALCFRRRRLGRAVGVVVALLGVLLAILIAGHLSLVPDFRRLTAETRSAPELVAGMILIALMLLLGVGSVFAWLERLLPGASRRGSMRGELWFALAATAVAAALVSQFYLSASKVSLWDTFYNGEPGVAAALGYLLEFAPVLIANLIANFSASVLIVGLASWFWIRAGDGEIPFTGWRERVMFGLLFAIVVVGIGGTLHGYAFPLGFLVGVPTTAVAVALMTRSRQGRIVGNPKARRKAKKYLRRTLKLSALRHRRRTMQTAIRQNEKAPREMAPLDAKRERLLDLDALNSKTLRGREVEIFAVGLSGRAGARSRWDGLGPFRFLILAGPIAYSAYAVVHHDFHDAVSANAPAGLGFLAASLLAQTVIWPAAAWAFVVVAPLLPGRIGPFKGMIAGLFCVIPVGISTLFLGDGHRPESWLFVPAEMTLVFVAIGFLLDYRRVVRVGGDLKEIGELYSLTSIRASAAYLAPLAILLFGVIHALATGNGVSGLSPLLAETLGHP